MAPELQFDHTCEHKDLYYTLTTLANMKLTTGFTFVWYFFFITGA